MTEKGRRPGVNQGAADTTSSQPQNTPVGYEKLFVNLGGVWVDLRKDAVWTAPYFLVPAGDVPAVHPADAPGAPVYGDRRIPVYRVIDWRQVRQPNGNGFIDGRVEASGAFRETAHAQFIVGAAPGDSQQPVVCFCGQLHMIDVGVGRHGAAHVLTDCYAPEGIRYAVIIPEPHPNPQTILSPDAAAQLAHWLARDGVVPGWAGDTYEERAMARRAAEQAPGERCDRHGVVPATCAEHGCALCAQEDWITDDCEVCDRLAQASHLAELANSAGCADEDCPICEDCRECRCQLVAGGRSLCRLCVRCPGCAEELGHGCDHSWWNPTLGRWSP